MTEEKKEEEDKVGKKTRICKSCKVEKNISEFMPIKLSGNKGENGYRLTCKKCYKNRRTQKRRRHTKETNKKLGLTRKKIKSKMAQCAIIGRLEEE